MKVGGSRVATHDGVRANELCLISSVAAWCESLQGNAPLIGSLESLAVGIGAEAVAMARVPVDEFAESRSIAFDRLNKRSPLPRLEKSYARVILGAYVSRPRAASIWFKSMVEQSPDPSLNEFHARRKMSELAVIPLEVGDKCVDFLEIHFLGPIDPERHVILNMIASTLSQTWRSRRLGLMTDTLLSRKKPDRGSGQSCAILDYTNPAKLSRAEFRVCLLLGKGFSVAHIGEELKVTEPTLRSHLRNIYLKTETGSLSELLFKLLSTSRAPDPGIQEKYA